MSWIERERGIVAVAFVRAEAAVGNAFAPCVHDRGVPELGEVPIVFAQVRHRVKDLATGNGSFIVDDGAGGPRSALQLRPSFECGFCDEVVHIHVDGGLEETGVTCVIVLDRGVQRIFADHVRQPVVPCFVDE